MVLEGIPAALASHRDSLFPNGLLYDTLIGVLGLDTGHYEARFDLSSKQYKVKHFPVLNGTRVYAESIDGDG